MVLLDTDHLTVLERGGPQAGRLLARLAQLPSDEVAATIISYEEQTRGWLSFVARARTRTAQVEAYRRLQRHLEIYCDIPLLAFDERAASTFAELQTQRVRIGTMDLKIAAIALTVEGLLLTRNLSDFRRIPDLRVADWTE